MAIGFNVSCGECGSKSCRCNGRTLSTGYEVLNAKIDATAATVRERATRPFEMIGTSGDPCRGLPDAANFRILDAYAAGGLSLIRVEYPGCLNYEGQKVLLLRKNIEEIQQLSLLDPHFLQKDENGLLARFVPTDEGWLLGFKLLNSML